MHKKSALIDSIKKALLPVFEKFGERLVFSYLFGSAAAGETTSLSDVDIAVYFAGGKGDSHFEDRLSLYADICRALKSNDIDLLVLNSATNLIILEEIVRHGVILCDRDPDLREEFELKVLHLSIDFREQRLAVMGV
jgi:predicted nucleotidyltransferase